MHNGRVLDLRTTPQALAALRELRQQAAGPFLTEHNLGHAPVRSGQDIMRPLPLPDGLRHQVAVAIDAHLQLRTADPFVPPVRMAPQHEAHVMWGIKEICRQRHLAAADSGHPLERVAAGLTVRKTAPPAAGGRLLGEDLGRMRKDQALWRRARRLAQAAGRSDDDRYVATLFKELGAAVLRKRQARAYRRVVAARCALPGSRLAWLAECSGDTALAKDKITFAQVQRLALALRQLRADQKTSLRLTGRGLGALAAAFPGYERADHLRVAEKRLLAAQGDRSAQAKLDDCLLAEAHAALALKPAQR